MARYFAQRLAHVVPVLLIASIAVWGMIYLVPGDPAVILLGEEASPDQLAQVRNELGLDRPVAVQYLDWLRSAVQGDLGRSFVNRHPVAELVSGRAVATLQLALVAMIVATLIAVPMGVLASRLPQSWLSVAVHGYSTLALATPVFWVGLIILLVAGVQLRLLPVASSYVPLLEDPLRAIQQIAGPVLALSFFTSGLLMRFIVASLGTELNRDYVRTARAKGAGTTRVVFGHAAINAVLPVMTVVGLQVGTFVGGAVLVEVVFSYPGLGRLLLTAVVQRDYPLIQAGVLYSVLAFVVVNVLLDIAYGLIDPRIRHAK